jgi:hypothetical protein
MNNMSIKEGVRTREVHLLTIAEAKSYRFIGATEVWSPSLGVITDRNPQPLPAAVVETFYRPGIGMVTQEVAK